MNISKEARIENLFKEIPQTFLSKLGCKTIKSVTNSNVFWGVTPGQKTVYVYCKFIDEDNNYILEISKSDQFMIDRIESENLMKIRLDVFIDENGSEIKPLEVVYTYSR